MRTIFSPIFYVEFTGDLNVYLVHHSGKRDALTDVLLAGEPDDGPFDAEPEAAVRHRAVFS